MSVPEGQKILDEGEAMEEQPVQWIANVASKAAQKAAYWQGRCEGLEITLAYLKNRLDRAESRCTPDDSGDD